VTDLDLITVGRVSVDLYARETGVGFDGAQTFEKSVGGSPTNVAVAAARLGHRAAVATKVGDDPFGRYVRRKLESFGVDTRFIGTHPTLRTPLAFAAMDPPDDPPILFYRQPEAPDMTITPDEIDAQSVREVPIFWVSASVLSRDPIAATVSALFEERSRRRHTVLDLDYRADFWVREADARERIGGAVTACTVAVGNRTECDIAVGSADPHTAADRLLERGVELAIVKRGADGVLVAWAGGREVVPPRPVTVVCGLGAGDAFGGALCHGLLSGWEPRQIVEYANAAGAIVASRLLCSDAMPSDHEVGALLGWSDAPG
jgi:5-dehydro-2-deoxygluconokinase